MAIGLPELFVIGLNIAILVAMVAGFVWAVRRLSGGADRERVAELERQVEELERKVEE